MVKAVAPRQVLHRRSRSSQVCCSQLQQRHYSQNARRSYFPVRGRSRGWLRHYSLSTLGCQLSILSHFIPRSVVHLDLTDPSTAPLGAHFLLSFSTVAFIAKCFRLTIAAFLDLLSTFHFTSHSQPGGHQIDVHQNIQTRTTLVLSRNRLLARLDPLLQFPIFLRCGSNASLRTRTSLAAPVRAEYISSHRIRVLIQKSLGAAPKCRTTCLTL
jgi:hypothetical protein